MTWTVEVPDDINPYPVDSVTVVEVIRTRAGAGHGTEENPFRMVEQYWLDGHELCRKDPGEREEE
jgi:hypothetical protein